MSDFKQSHINMITKYESKSKVSRENRNQNSKFCYVFCTPLVLVSKVIQIGSTRQIRKMKPIQPGINLIKNEEFAIEGWCSDQFWSTGNFKPLRKIT